MNAHPPPPRNEPILTLMLGLKEQYGMRRPKRITDGVDITLFIFLPKAYPFFGVRYSCENK